MAERVKFVKRVLTAALIFSMAGSEVVNTKYHSPGGCDPSLRNHVYSPDRLNVVDTCITVQGTIISIEEENDGDAHVLLRPDPEYVDIINDYRFKINVRDQKGALVTEPVPINGIRQDFGLYVGEHVKMTGVYASDTWHNGWLEIHPITSAVDLGKK